MTARYVLTADEEADLREIVRYSRRQWGEAQTRTYADKLTRGIERLVRGDRGFKDMTEISPGLRMSRCEHHYIFCFPREEALALVIAILHERMDLMAWLAARLAYKIAPTPSRRRFRIRPTPVLLHCNKKLLTSHLRRLNGALQHRRMNTSAALEFETTWPTPRSTMPLKRLMLRRAKRRRLPSLSSRPLR